MKKVGYKDLAANKPLVSRLCKQFNITSEQILKKANWKKGGRGDTPFEIISYMSWIKYAADVERNFKTKLFFATPRSKQRCMETSRS
jgi:hypothetical protein